MDESTTNHMIEGYDSVLANLDIETLHLTQYLRARLGSSVSLSVRDFEATTAEQGLNAKSSATVTYRLWLMLNARYSCEDYFLIAASAKHIRAQINRLNAPRNLLPIATARQDYSACCRCQWKSIVRSATLDMPAYLTHFGIMQTLKNDRPCETTTTYK